MISLAGRWQGRFRYPRGLGDTGFEAVIEDAGAGFLAEIIDDTGPPAHAKGYREDSAVTFVKRYRGTRPGYERPVRYHGHLSEDGCRIDGVWQIDGIGGWGGVFFMERPKPAPAQAKTAVETTIDA